jgi:dynein heavy chain 1
VQVAHEELQDLKGVWAELSKIWEQIDELKEKPWLSVQPRKVSIQTKISKQNHGGLYNSENSRPICVFQFVQVHALEEKRYTFTTNCPVAEVTYQCAYCLNVLDQTVFGWITEPTEGTAL